MRQTKDELRAALAASQERAADLRRRLDEADLRLREHEETRAAHLATDDAARHERNKLAAKDRAEAETARGHIAAAYLALVETEAALLQFRHARTGRQAGGPRARVRDRRRADESRARGRAIPGVAGPRAQDGLARALVDGRAWAGAYALAGAWALFGKAATAANGAAAGPGPT